MERKKRHSLGGFAPVLELGGGGGGDNRPKGGDLALFLGFWNTTTVEGGSSGCSQPPVDINMNVAFQYMLLILNRNFCCDVNRKLGTT